VDNIIREASRDGPALVVFTRHGERGQLDHPLSSTAHEVIHRLSGPFLLVPTVTAHRHTDLDTQWKTVMVPLDGSVRAECAIPAAENIACDRDAELLLFHAVPVPELSGPRPYSKQDLELASRLQERNRQAAEAYLERVRARFASHRVTVRTLVLESGPVKDSVADLLRREDIGLVVACAHGATGSQSWKFGGLAAHLIESSNCALLLIQDLSESSMRRLTHGGISVRRQTAGDWFERLHRR
jgi:nucleotide-binding universal stress UspA family protein